MGPSAIPPETSFVLHAAVVMPVILEDDPALVVVRRGAHLRRNPGQIAFPGGLVDPGDADPRATALREFEEELGIDRTRLRVVDRFDDVLTLARSVIVTPYLGFLEPPVHFTVDGDETASAHALPLRALYVPGAVHRGIETTLVDERSIDVATWQFDYGSVHVWGATARMLQALVVRYASVEALLASA